MRPSLFLLALVAISAPAAHAFNPGVNPMTCIIGTAAAPGTVCAQTSAYGQTLNDRPIQASAHVELIAKNYDRSNGNTEAIARIKIENIKDPTKFYFNEGSLPIIVRAKICGFHRECAWKEVSASFIVNRIYGTDTFESSPTFDVVLTGNPGSEYAQILKEIAILLPLQQFPIIINL